MTSAGAGAAVAWEDAAGFDVSSITGATDLAEEPNRTDEMVISDAGTLKRVDMQYIYTYPAFRVTMAAATGISTGTWTKLAFDTIITDEGNVWDESTNYRFTVPSGCSGMYQFNAKLVQGVIDEGEYIKPALYIGGSSQAKSIIRFFHSPPSDNYEMTINWVYVCDLAAAQYVELWIYHNSDADSDHEPAAWFSGFRITGST